jgi:hypothetical protein
MIYKPARYPTTPPTNRRHESRDGSACHFRRVWTGGVRTRLHYEAVCIEVACTKRRNQVTGALAVPVAGTHRLSVGTEMPRLLATSQGGVPWLRSFRAERILAFVMTRLRPRTLPCSRAAWRPACVRSTMSSRWNGTARSPAGIPKIGMNRWMRTDACFCLHFFARLGLPGGETGTDRGFFPLLGALGFMDRRLPGLERVPSNGSNPPAPDQATII